MDSHLLAVIALLVSPFASAQTAPPGGGSAAAQDGSRDPITITGVKDRKKKIVCETRVETGSVLPKRRCSTVAELEERQAHDRVAAEQLKSELNRQREARRLICLQMRTC